MWLLSTDRAELHLFSSPEEIDDGYAALSHVWDKTEQSFQDVRKIQERCASDGTNPRDFVCEKIRRCCELAESHGYKWVWIDTCCIDKTSSTELSEAINSMFRYYALSSICYGYLRDVECAEDYDDFKWRQRLLRSIWFQRGWTLQELIAPRFFLFVSKSWEVLRSKADLASDIQKATRIPAAVLRIEISHTTYSISQRMSWLGLRKTTRLEDEAYCLLGIFDVHMPALYGEGGNAFQRLQEAIMRQSVDTTLFAWGIEPDDPQTDDPRSFMPPSSGAVGFRVVSQSRLRASATRVATSPSTSAAKHICRARYRGCPRHVAIRHAAWSPRLYSHHHVPEHGFRGSLLV
ncbi:HET-domain-containing protein [Lentinus brumalis]|uniref:HET-domain-containing protein n=1 Tax=Lentinus brumalis TaxID=2498619 RepID=A0A371CJY2_9APHY|nr:HET-domain-containing protein [Polyporus brumalis]